LQFEGIANDKYLVM